MFLYMCFDKYKLFFRIGLPIVPIIVLIIYEKYSNIGDKIHG